MRKARKVVENILNQPVKGVDYGYCSKCGYGIGSQGHYDICEKKSHKGYRNLYHEELD